MKYRNGNYSAFYVAEPFSESGLHAHAAKDFCHYNMLRAWKGADSSFPFNDSHVKTYNVRDNSDWLTTLRPRLRKRLQSSKNIILFLSSTTANSKALREEMDYGMNEQGLPVIVVYPEYDSNVDLVTRGSLKQAVRKLWDKIPIFRDSLDEVPSLHVPFNKNLIEKALRDTDLMVATKTQPGRFVYE